MRNEFMRILADYPNARRETFRQHPMATFVRIAAAEAVRAALGATRTGLMIEGHPGQGGWADSPWIGILDPVVTTDPKSGYYACYLFPSDMSGLVLSLQLGMVRMKSLLQGRAWRTAAGSGCIDALRATGSWPKTPSASTGSLVRPAIARCKTLTATLASATSKRTISHHSLSFQTIARYHSIRSV